MAIMAAAEWNDDRSTTLSMAEKALECIRDSTKIGASRVVLNNVYRLLEAFRGNPFFGYAPDDLPQELPLADRGSPSADPHSGDVRFAIEEALKEILEGQEPAAAVKSVEAVLRGIVAPDRYPAPGQAERERAARFFVGLSQRLAFA